MDGYKDNIEMKSTEEFESRILSVNRQSIEQNEHHTKGENSTDLNVFQCGTVLTEKSRMLF